MPFLLVLAVLFAATPAAAQTSTEPGAEVERVIQALFDAMRAADGAAAEALFHPEARLQSVSGGAGSPALRSTPIADFLAAVGTPRDEMWDEKIDGLEVRVDGDLATAWMTYRFYRGTTFSHCGVNAVQLFRDAGDWRIIQIADTRRTER